MRGLHRMRGLGQFMPSDIAAAAVGATPYVASGQAGKALSVAAMIGTSPTVSMAVDSATGPFMVKDSSGNVIDCNQIYNMTNQACWGIPGGSAGTPLNAAGQVDCTQFENVINGACSMAQWAGLNPALSFSLAGGGLLLVGVGVLAVLLLVRR